MPAIVETEQDTNHRGCGGRLVSLDGRSLPLRKLPRAPRRAIEMRIAAAGGESDTSLAAHLGMRLNTFLQNVTRARRLLAQCLEKAGVVVPA